MPSELVATVALRATIKRGENAVFSYAVPAWLRGQVEPGQLVWVPFRRQRVQGVVLALAPDAPLGVGALREISDLADREAVITPAGLELAQWVAATYRVSLYEALTPLLPPGVSQQADATWRATPAGLAASLGTLPERERAILYFLRTRGEVAERDLRSELRGSDSELREAYALLAERGLVTRGTVMSAPRARPRVERMAQLCGDDASIATALEDLARAPRQHAVVRWLWDQEPRTKDQEPQNQGTGDRGQGTGDRGQGEHPYPEPVEGPDNQDTRYSDTATRSTDHAARSTQFAVPVSAVYAATGANAGVLRTLEHKGLLKFSTREVRRDPLAGDGVPPDQPPQLTPSQRRAWEPLSTALAALAAPDAAQPAPAQTFLLHGVTGSGKTEIYLRSIARAMRLGRQALVLVPEIALTAQLVRRFAARFPGQLAVLHSGLSLGERYDEWRRLRHGTAKLAIGSRSAVFAPLPRLGLIIVDEEHETTYKHDANPRYHARDAALQLGAVTGSVVILGSATPSVESYYAARSKRYQLLEMTERVGSIAAADGLQRTVPLPLPPVRLVDMRRELQSGNRSIFSRVLQQALVTALERNEQAILFLNRRGAAAFVMCRDCGYVVECLACSGPLTLHYDDSSHEAADGMRDSTLVCHSCGYHQLVPTICPQCLSPRIKDFGVGTQRVEEEVQRLFPEARVLRWDRDTISGKGAHTRMLDRFLGHEADILVGTQMIAKGLDLPLVSLVGVVIADTGLHLPDFRSGERSFQLLTQVAGRAGRRSAGAQVVIQTYTPEHYALQAAQEHDFHAFYVQEIAFRRQTSYPPFGRIVRFVHASGSESAGERAASALAEQVRGEIERRGLHDWSVIGPAPAFLQRVRGRWRWHLLLRVPTDHADRQVLGAFLDALEPLYGWTIDVDPVHVL